MLQSDVMNEGCRSQINFATVDTPVVSLAYFAQVASNSFGFKLMAIYLGFITF